MKRFTKQITTVVCGAMMMGAVAMSSSETRADDVLTIGSKAPSLDIEHWVSDGNGRYPHLTDFEEGKVYVVEFWATWCGPCISSMPHLAETQLKYADDGLQFISVSDENLETVEKFLERKVRGKDDETYGELTSVYCLTTDPDGSVSRDYMEAAAQNGIPTAFVVGKNGIIEWIGHPMQMDDPLEQILNDKWDREAFATEFIAEQEAERVMSQIYGKLNSVESPAEAVEILSEAISSAESDAVKLQLGKIKFQAMTQTDAKAEEIKTELEGLFKLADTPGAANELGWLVYTGISQGMIKGKELTEVAISKTVSAAESAPSSLKASILDTVAHLFDVNGELDKAIEYQTMAIEASKIDNEKAELQKYLDQLNERKEDDQDEKEDE